jgi:hypothetical protein
MMGVSYMKHIRNTLVGLYASLFLVILLLVCLFWGLLDQEMGSWRQWLVIFALIISGVLNVISAIVNIKNAYQLCKNSDTITLRKYMKRLKLGAIPYFILNFVFFLLLFLLFFAASRGIFIFTPIPMLFLIPIFFTYLAVLFTSPYAIGFAVVLSNENKMKTGKLVIHILLQLCFVLDVVDTIVLLKKYKPQQIPGICEELQL